jgi:tripartite-type tricarboxylate transporter receptor subunit TctC
VEQKLRDAFRFAVNSDEFKTVAGRIDAPLMYLDGPDYKKYVAQMYQHETQLIQRLKLKELLEKN